MALAGIGCAVLAGGDLLVDPRAAGGDLLALAGAATAAAYLAVGRGMRARVPLTPYLAAVNLLAGLGLGVAAVATGVTWTGLGALSWAAMAAAAVVPSLVGHTLLNWSVRRTPTHLVSLAILGEPVGATLITWLAFAEVPPVAAAIGGAVILAGIRVGFARSSTDG
jgi:drug/metabolite transporter (DMT)-like permease